MSNVKLSIPYGLLPLRAAIVMLTKMADDLDGLALDEPITGTVEKRPDNSASGEQINTTTESPDHDPLSLDAEGIPWDERIHGVAKKRTAKENTWVLIRNIEKNKPGLVEQVKAELLGNAPLNTEINGGEQQDTSNVANQAFGNQDQDQEPAATGITFADMMGKITPRVTAKPDYNQTIQAVLLEFNVSGGLPALLAAPDLIPQIDARLDELWQG